MCGKPAWAASLCILIGVLLPRLAAQPSGQSYRIEVERIEREGRLTDRIHSFTRRDAEGRERLYLTVAFKIFNPDGSLAQDVLPGEIQVHEGGKQVSDLEVRAPTMYDELSTVLALDSSGSMREQGKWDESQLAAKYFLDCLHPRVRAGMIPFDHRLRERIDPTTDRDALSQLLQSIRPGGGTAYLDATAAAVRMLEDRPGKRAVVVMTDGIDLNSKRTLNQTIVQARESATAVYVIGVGEPARQKRSRIVLVLDCSGSMGAPADQGSGTSKLEALKRAGNRFLEMLRPGAEVALLAFSTKLRISSFTDDKTWLQSQVRQLRTEGGTNLYDAIEAALRALEEESDEPVNAKAVIVLTDGRDESPRRSFGPAAAIGTAKRSGVPIYTIGFGKQGDFNGDVLEKLAQETGGTYQHARGEQSLFEVFEQLAFSLFDDGIDEAGLKSLAEETGGRYFPVRGVSGLQELFGNLADELQTTYTVTFPSHRPSQDGTARDVQVRVLRNGQQVSNLLTDAYSVSGVVAPTLDPIVFLVTGIMLAALLALPGYLRGSRAEQVAEGG